MHKNEAIIHTWGSTPETPRYAVVVEMHDEPDVSVQLRAIRAYGVDSLTGALRPMEPGEQHPDIASVTADLR
jgi:hypothetical protein